jgi:hypothetical protein
VLARRPACSVQLASAYSSIVRVCSKGASGRPAENAGPSPVTTIARTATSASRSCSAARSCTVKPGLKQLRRSRSDKVTIAICPSRTTRTRSPAAVEPRSSQSAYGVIGCLRGDGERGRVAGRSDAGVLLEATGHHGQERRARAAYPVHPAHSLRHRSTGSIGRCQRRVRFASRARRSASGPR